MAKFGLQIEVKYTPDPPPDKIIIWRKIDSGVLAAMMYQSVISLTDEGLDAGGKAFKPYSSRYARRKGTTRVTMRKTGRFMSSLRAKALSRKAKVEPPKKVRQYMVYPNRTRQVMGIGKDLQRALVAKFAELVMENIKRGAQESRLINALGGDGEDTGTALGSESDGPAVFLTLTDGRGNVL